MLSELATLTALQPLYIKVQNFTDTIQLFNTMEICTFPFKDGIKMLLLIQVTDFKELYG